MEVIKYHLRVHGYVALNGKLERDFAEKSLGIPIYQLNTKGSLYGE